MVFRQFQSVNEEVEFQQRLSVAPYGIRQFSENCWGRFIDTLSGACLCRFDSNDKLHATLSDKSATPRTAEVAKPAVFQSDQIRTQMPQIPQICADHFGLICVSICVICVQLCGQLALKAKSAWTCRIRRRVAPMP